MKPSRRHLLLSITAMSCANRAGSSPIRLAICNNTFQGSSFSEACRLAARAGYTGLEIGPVTLSEDPAALPPAERAELRRVMSGEGLTFVGLHNLLAAPKGLHITTPDEAVRERSWEYFRRLIDLCADLGGGGMVLGSSKQRDAVDGVSRESATSRIRDGLAALAPHASERNVLLLPETLAPQLSNVLNTLDETVAMVRSINHPAVQTLFDTHNTVGETEPHDALIQRYAAHLRHVHLNEMDGRHPGTGGYDFALILRALRAIQYQGWASVEVFQFQPSGEEIARSSAAYVRKIEAAL